MSDAVMRAGIRFLLAGGVSALSTEEIDRIREALTEERNRRYATEDADKLTQVIGPKLAKLWGEIRRYGKTGKKTLTFFTEQGFRRHVVSNMEVSPEATHVLIMARCWASSRYSAANAKTELQAGIRDTDNVRRDRMPELCRNCRSV